MSNSLELLQGSIVDIQKKYEILSDIVSEAKNGKVLDIWFFGMELVYI